jgi:CRISPR-associated protein Cmr1
MRKAPLDSPAPASRAVLATGLVRERHTYRFLTPVFGGGVRVEGHQKPSDPRTPIRVPSIRGQLRFWWRACNPQRCTTFQELHKKEAEVFGATSKTSSLSICVVTPPTQRQDFLVLDGKFNAVQGREGLAYGAFPLRDSTPNMQHGVLHKYTEEWALEFIYPECIRDDIATALWAWTHFGGLGGRTRRGFGAIEETTAKSALGAPSTISLLSIEEGWKRYVHGAAVPWPHLPREPRLRIAPHKQEWKEGVDAQNFLLGSLRKLRQGDIGRKKADAKSGNRPGRSYWPEADSIREIVGQSAPAHKKRVTRVKAFPRAVFGLPIIFHFKDKGDPSDSTLLPKIAKETKERGRLASPLILRPHRGANGEIEAVALILAHPPPAEVVLTGKSLRTPTAVETKLSESDARTMGVENRPSPLTKDGHVFVDPLERFLEEIR